MSNVSAEYTHVHTCGVHVTGKYMHTQSDVENCEGWLSPGGHSSDSRALSEAPGSIPGGCPFFTKYS